MKVSWYHGMGSYLRLRWNGHKVMHKCKRMWNPNLYASSDIIPEIGTKGSKPRRECTNWTLHENHISPKQPKIVNKEWSWQINSKETVWWMMGHKKESNLCTQRSRIHYQLHEGDHRCKDREKGVNILHKWSRGRNVTTPKSMSTVRGYDAPKSDTRVYTRTKDGW